MYYEIFVGPLTEIATSAVSAVVENLVNRYFTGREAKKKETPDEEFPLIAVPLAIGYYYNFIEKIEERLAGDNLTVKRHYQERVLDRLSLSAEQVAKLTPDEFEQMKTQRYELTKFVGRFEPSAIKVELLYPKQLTNPILRNCSAYLQEKTSRGSIESTVGGRPYGINFLDDAADGSAIKIVDYTRPVEVILRYYQEVKGIGGLGGDAGQWRKIQDQEMQSFLFTLKYLVENKSKFLYNKIEFRPFEN